MFVHGLNCSVLQTENLNNPYLTSFNAIAGNISSMLMKKTDTMATDQTKQDDEGTPDVRRHPRAGCGL